MLSHRTSGRSRKTQLLPPPQVRATCGPSCSRTCSLRCGKAAGVPTCRTGVSRALGEVMASPCHHRAQGFGQAQGQGSEVPSACQLWPQASAFLSLSALSCEVGTALALFGSMAIVVMSSRSSPVMAAPLGERLTLHCASSKHRPHLVRAKRTSRPLASLRDPEALASPLSALQMPGLARSGQRGASAQMCPPACPHHS